MISSRHGQRLIMCCVAVVLALTLLIGIPCAGGDVAAAESDWDLTIMHTNDTHAHLKDIARRAAVVKQIRTVSENSLLLDAGDVFTGTLYFTQYQGIADVNLMNKLNYDAMALGNHEFDKGPQGLANFLSEADFPALNANFDFSAEPVLNSIAHSKVGLEGADKLKGQIYPAIILDLNGEKVGLIGLDTEETSELSSPGLKIVIKNASTAAHDAVNLLQNEGVNRIVAVSHLGWDLDVKLAADVEGIDIIVGGHSHTVAENYPEIIDEKGTPTLVVQAGDYGKYLGKLDVSFDDEGIIRDYNGGLIDLSAQDAEGHYIYSEDTEVADTLASYSESQEDLKNIVVGKSKVLLDGVRENVRSRESNLGNLIADAMLEKASSAGASIAITNGGGIKESIDQGAITLGEVMTVMPFANTLVQLDLTGQQIIDALENGVSEVELLKGKFPQVAGLRFTFDPTREPGNRVSSVEVKTEGGYEAINTAENYKVVTNKFMAGGGDGYTSLTYASQQKNLGFVDYEVFQDYLANHSPVSPAVEGRITNSSDKPTVNTTFNDYLETTARNLNYMSAWLLTEVIF